MNHTSLKLLVIYVGCCVPLLLLWQCTSFFSAAPTPFFAHTVVAVASQPVKVHFALNSIGAGGAYIDAQTYPANCKGVTTTALGALKYVSGLEQSDINTKYLKQKNNIICYDLWKPTWTSTSGDTYTVADFLTIVGWPKDFFVVKKNITLLIRPLTGPNPVVTPKPTPTPAPTTAQQNKSQNACDWVPDLVVAHPHIDICAFFLQTLNANVAQPLRNAFNSVANQTNDFLWSTPAKDTYKNPDFTYFQNLSIWLVNAYLAVLLAWVAIRGSIVKTFSWLSYADILEYLPRIGFGLLAAYSSTHLVQIVIDGSNALCSVFSHALFDSLTKGNATDMVSIVLQIVYLIMGLLLILEEGARYSILFVIIAFFPLLLFTASAKETQFIARGAVRGFIFMVLLQPVQMAVMAVGITVLQTILHGDVGNILSYLVSIGLMIFVLSLFFSFFRLAFGSVGSPFAAAATGFAGMAAGASLRGAVQGSRAVMAGRAAIQRGTKQHDTRNAKCRV